MDNLDFKTIILSVPHSGTRFLQQRFDVIKCYHTWGKWEDVRQICEEAEKIYVPMRHPKDVKDSWIRRDRFKNKRGIYMWYMAWYQLQAMDSMFDLDVICVDKKEDERIDDWTVVGHDELPWPSNFHDVYWDILFHLPIVERHYER
jgi:hypothetical protein